MTLQSEIRLPKTVRAWLIWGLKLFLSSGLLFFTLRKVSLAEAGQAILRARPGWMLLSLGLFILSAVVLEPLRLVMASRLLREKPLPALEWGTLFMQSRAFLYILPSGMGQEGFLWWRLRKLQWSHASCLFVVTLVRVIGLATWGGVLALSLRSASFRMATRVFLLGPLAEPWLWALLAAALLTVSFLLPGVLFRLQRLEAYDPPPGGWRDLLLSTLATTLVSSFAFQCAGQAFGLGFHLVQSGACLTLLFLAMLLPVSLAGFGVQEGLLLLIGKGLGIASAPILGLSCVLHLQRLLLALVGLGTFVLAPQATSEES